VVYNAVISQKIKQLFTAVATCAQLHIARRVVCRNTADTRLSQCYVVVTGLTSCSLKESFRSRIVRGPTVAHSVLSLFLQTSTLDIHAISFVVFPYSGIILSCPLHYYWTEKPKACVAKTQPSCCLWALLAEGSMVSAAVERPQGFSWIFSNSRIAQNSLFATMRGYLSIGDASRTE
jgi:hypothetical protein